MYFNNTLGLTVNELKTDWIRKALVEILSKEDTSEMINELPNFCKIITAKQIKLKKIKLSAKKALLFSKFDNTPESIIDNTYGNMCVISTNNPEELDYLEKVINSDVELEKVSIDYNYCIITRGIKFFNIEVTETNTKAGKTTEKVLEDFCCRYGFYKRLLLKKQAKAGSTLFKVKYIKLNKELLKKYANKICFYLA